MTKAPARIWLDYTLANLHRAAFDEPPRDDYNLACNEYVRADCAPEFRARWRDAMEAAAQVAERHGRPRAAENTKRRMGNPVRVTARPMALLSIRIAAAIRALPEPPEFRAAREADVEMMREAAEVNSRYAAEITRLRAENAALTRERDALREALNEIAAWDDHGGNRGLERDGTYGRFDEPGAVRTARTALKGAPDA